MACCGRVELAGLSRLLALAGGGVERFRLEERGREVHAGAEAVWRALEALEVEDGWLCCADRVIALDAPGRLARQEAVPLDGELRLVSGETVHLRHLGESRWEAAVLARVDDPGGVGTVRRLRRQDAPGRCLRYEVEWRLVPDAFGQPVLRPWRSRFAGFAEAAGEEA